MDAVTTEATEKAPRWDRQGWNFLVASRAEMHKVSWPSRDELAKATRMIVIMAIVLGLVIGWLDLLLNVILVEWLAKLTA